MFAVIVTTDLNRIISKRNNALNFKMHRLKAKEFLLSIIGGECGFRKKIKTSYGNRVQVFNSIVRVCIVVGRVI